MVVVRSQLTWALGSCNWPQRAIDFRL